MKADVYKLIEEYRTLNPKAQGMYLRKIRAEMGACSRSALRAAKKGQTETALILSEAAMAFRRALDRLSLPTGRKEQP